MRIRSTQQPTATQLVPLADGLQLTEDLIRLTSKQAPIDATEKQVMTYRQAVEVAPVVK